MRVTNGQVEVLTVPRGDSLWEGVCARMAEFYQENIWKLPTWIMPDIRHKEAAESKLMEILGVKAIPTGNLHTILSLAGEILHLPILDVTITPPSAVLLLHEIISDECPDTYRNSSCTPGFLEALWRSIERVEQKGYFPEEMVGNASDLKVPTHLKEVHRRLHEAPSKRSRYTAGEILRCAREELLNRESVLLQNSTVFIGPLVFPTPLELEFIKALILRSEKSYLIPAPGSDWHRQIVDPIRDSSELTLPVEIEFFQPQTPEIEVDTVFGHIASKVAGGAYRYRDFRIIYPSTQEVIPLLESAGRRYHVPLKGQITRRLKEFPGAKLLSKLFELFESAWERRQLLEVLRSGMLKAPQMEISDAIKYVLNHGNSKTLPSVSFWIELFRTEKLHNVVIQLESLQKLDAGNSGSLTGAEFSEWLIEGIDFIRNREEDYFQAVDQSIEERGWETLIDLISTFRLQSSRPSRRPVLIEAFIKALNMCNYMLPNRHTDAVEICSGTQEDHLPIKVIIYLGLTSRIPSPVKTSPFFGDEDPKGYAEQLQQFQLHLANAQERALVSGPQYDDEGSELAASPFIKSLENRLGRQLSRIDMGRWDPKHQEHREASPPAQIWAKNRITGGRALSRIRERNLFWSPTQVEDAIQCRYLHFAKNILKLETLQDAISVGVTPLLLGSIAHHALERFLELKKEGETYEVAKWIREEFLRRTSHLDHYLEMDRDLEDLTTCIVDFIENEGGTLVSGFIPAEQEFKFGGNSDTQGLKIAFGEDDILMEGRIDRIDAGQNIAVVIFDYKYKKFSNKADFFADFYAGLKPQVLIYGLFMQEIMEKNPVALLEIYLRSSNVVGVKLGGSLNLNENFQKNSDIRTVDIEERARLFAKALNVINKCASQMAEGDILPTPKDVDRCGPGNCEYADLCRYRQRWMNP